MRWLSPGFLLLLVVHAAPAEQIITLHTREGVTQSYSLLVPATGAPRAAAVLFPGNAGRVRLRYRGDTVQFSSRNFLVRARGEFARRGIAAAVVDTPSDRPAGMTDAFRAGPAHLADIRAVVADLERRLDAIPVFLVGTSRGTVSAAHLAAQMDGEIAGVVLTSAVYRPSSAASPGLSGFDFDSIDVPLLLVHHRRDGCRVAPYAAARAEADRYPLITVSGGTPLRPGRCSALAEHGYYGRERAVVEAIVKWMTGERYPSEID